MDIYAKNDLRNLIASGAGLRVLVCGGRDYTDLAAITAALNRFTDAYARPAVIIHGGARGVDRLAGVWAREHRIRTEVYYPDWSVGRFAGIARNQRMIDIGKPHCIVAFPGGHGTADMVRRATESRLPVFMGAEAPLHRGRRIT